MSTKISGLAVDTEYVFHLVLRTSAGTYSSEKLTVRTHKMTELSGITVTPGIMPASLKESMAKSLQRMGAKMADTVRIDTTHFVCTEGRGPAWERAVEMNVPVVVPDWVKGCEREGRIVGVRGYYLNADPRLRQVGPIGGSQQHEQPTQQRQSVSNQGQPVQSPRTEVTPPTPERQTEEKQAEEEEESEDEEAPPPPPKEEGEAPEPKTAVEEPKARAEDVKPPAPSAEDEEESEEEGEEEHNDKEVEANLPVREKREGKGSGEDDSGSFQEVAL